MSTLLPPPPVVEVKAVRRISRRQGLFAPDLLKTALARAFVMLRPDVQWKNPVMFTVEVGAILTFLYTIAKIITPDAYTPTIGYLIALDLWLFLTVLFANFAEALAEARGKAQAESLRKTRQETPAYKVRRREDVERVMDLPAQEAIEEADDLVERTVSTALQEGDLVVVETGQVIPSDGEIVAGIASVDESAITGESAPVGARGRRRPLRRHRRHPRPVRPHHRQDHGLGGQDVPRPHDRPGRGRHPPAHAERDRSVAGAVELHPDLPDRVHRAVADGLQRRAVHAGLDGDAPAEPRNGHPDAGGAAGLPDPHDDRRPARGHRHRRHGSRPAREHFGQERQVGRGGRRRGHALAG